jgi:hypothetical protein
MKRFLVAAVGAAMILTPASMAWARGDGWQPYPLGPFDIVVCEANMHVDLAGEAWYRIVTLGGQEVEQVTGHAFATITNVDNGRTITQNISGANLNPLGAPEYSGRGHNLIFLDPTQAESAGLPELLLLNGYLDLTFNTDDTVTVNKMTGDLVDDCALLT